MTGPAEWSTGTPELFALLDAPKKTATVLTMPARDVPATERTKRARAYLAACEPAVSGSSGHQQTWAAALAVTVGFDLTDDEAYALLTEYNARCQPPWTERELWHKVRSASKNARRPRGYLLERKPQSLPSARPRAASSTTDDEWRSLLRFSGGNNPKLLKTAHNVEVVLRNDERWRGVLARNRFSDAIVVRKPPPFDRFADAPVYWRDIDDTLVQGWFEREYDVTISVDAVMRGVEAAAQAASFHPVREYFDTLVWDGNKRLDGWLTRAFDVEQTPYSVAVGSKWMISAVARIFEPGCKVDCVIVLEGDQGALKSTAALTLCGNEDWYIDELEEVGTKDAAAQLSGRWIIELAELNALNRAEWNTIKAFASRQVDRYRPAYGHRVVNQPRQCVFIGTVNPNGQGYLRDETGNRRFWPVTCQRMADIEWLRANRDQLWAEAIARYKGRERWYLEDAGVKLEAAREQLARVQREAWQEKLEHWLVGRDETSVAEVLERFFSLSPEKWDLAIQQRAGRALIIAGWTRTRAAPDASGKRPWVYRRKSTDQLSLALS